MEKRIIQVEEKVPAKMLIPLSIQQIGLVVTGAGSFGIGTIVALILVAILLFLLFRPDPYKNQNDVTKRSVQAAE